MHMGTGHGPVQGVAHGSTVLRLAAARGAVKQEADTWVQHTPYVGTRAPSSLSVRSLERQPSVTQP
jgi:hypothetical protein